MEYYTGIDLHKKFVQMTTLDRDGNVAKRRRVRNDPELIAHYFVELPGVHRAVFESCVGWYWVRDLLESLSISVVMAHPMAVKAIAYAKVKTDAVDSATLAMLLRADLIPEAHMISRQRRALRDVVRRRHRLVEQRTRQLNAAQGILQAVNCTSVEELEPVDRVNYECLTSTTRVLNEQICAIEKLVALTLRDDPDYLLVQTIPGIGPVHAAEILLETDSITRFASEDNYFSYARVVPGSNNSGDRVAHRTSRQGNGHLRRVFGDAAVHAVNQHPDFARLHARELRRKPEPIAWAIVAKQIARGVHHVLSNHEPYRGLKGAGLSKPKACQTMIMRKLKAGDAM